MALLNHAKKELSAKIVYYGPGLSGKTTNLEWVHRKWEPDKRGKLISLETKTDRTLFFDFLPVQIGEIGGYRTRFNVYTVPGQIFYNETRRMVLKGVDGIVFVADSQQEMASENVENLKNLAENLRSIGKDIKQIPMVIQYNKRDLPNTLTVDELNRLLNREGLPFFEAIAVQGEGVLTTLARVTRMVADNLKTGLFASVREEVRAPEPAPAPNPPAAARCHPAESAFVSATEDGPAFLGELRENASSPRVAAREDREGPGSLMVGDAGFRPDARWLAPESPVRPRNAPTLELPNIFGEESPVLAGSAALAGESAEQEGQSCRQEVPAPPREQDETRAAENWVDPSVVSFAEESGPGEDEPVELSVLLGNPERKAANEVRVPLSIRSNGTGKRLTFRLVIRLDPSELSA